MIEYTDNIQTSQPLKLLAIGDLHVQMKNFPLLDIAIPKLIEKIRELKPDHIIFLGDILHYHSHLNEPELNRAIDIFHQISEIQPIHILVGNHDMRNDNQFLSSHHWMTTIEHMPNITIIDKGYTLETKAGKVVMVPFVPKNRFIEALDIIDEDWKSARLILGHQDFWGAKYESGVASEDGDKWSLEYPMVVTGHFHDKQLLHPNLYYTGSFQCVSSGEKKEKTIALCNLGNGKITIEEHSLNMPKNIEVHVSVDKFDSFELPDNTKNNVRVIVSGTVDELANLKKTKRYKELEKSGIKIKNVHKKSEIQISDPKITDFQDVLWNMVKDNPDMIELYKKYV